MKKVLFVLCVMFWAGVGSMAFAREMPNIVFILVDDMGYGDTGCYNPSSKVKTPYIDKVAAEGMRFVDAHSGGNYCIPSRYALMTGRFAVRSHLKLERGPLIEDGRMTIASLLRDNGYETAMVGKWHLGFDQFFPSEKDNDYTVEFKGGPVDCGFDTFFGMHASLDIPPYFFIHGRRAVMPPSESIEANNNVGGPEGWNNIQGAFWRAGGIAPDFKLTEIADRFAKEATGVIGSHRTAKDGKPLFLYLALPSPHTPWLPNEQFRGKSGAGMYGDYAMQIDAAVGKVLESIEKSGMKQDTMLILSSDNGPVWYDKDVKKFGHSSTGPLRGMKFDSWEGGHRMPFIVRWPGKAAAGSVTDRTIEFSDMFATFAELVGQKNIPEGMAEDSVSFLSCLLGKEDSKRAAIIHDRRTIRDGNWKLILPKNKKQGNGELYNLKDDISEKDNVIEKYPEIADKLRGRLGEFMKGI